MTEPRGVVLEDSETGQTITLPPLPEWKIKLEGRTRTVRLRMARGVLLKEKP